MSTFHVTAILGKRPELVGILGKNKIKHLHHARVVLVDLDFLHCCSSGNGGALGSTIPQFFIVSHDGTLLGEVGVDLYRTFFERVIWSLCLKTERVYEAMCRVGIDRVAYIAEFAPGCSEGACNCELIIHKPRGMMRVRTVNYQQDCYIKS